MIPTPLEFAEWTGTLTEPDPYAKMLCGAFLAFVHLIRDTGDERTAQAAMRVLDDLVVARLGVPPWADDEAPDRAAFLALRRPGMDANGYADPE